MCEVISSENSILLSAPKSNVISKIDLLMTSLSKFYADEKNINLILPIVQGCSKISLRVLDWFVTNYCKKHNTVINFEKDNRPHKIIVHLDYKNQLKAYSKRQFDPFCRRERINFIYGKGGELLTTVGQLNFFRWAIENNIIEYTGNHLDEIESDMNTSLRSDGKKAQSPKSTGTVSSEENTEVELIEKEKEKDKRRRKRHELSISASKSVSKHNVKITVEFS